MLRKHSCASITKTTLGNFVDYYYALLKKDLRLN
jgi:hypothetical protein